MRAGCDRLVEELETLMRRAHSLDVNHAIAKSGAVAYRILSRMNDCNRDLSINPDQCTQFSTTVQTRTTTLKRFEAVSHHRCRDAFMPTTAHSARRSMLQIDERRLEA